MLKKIIIGFMASILVMMLGVLLFAKDVQVTVSEAEAQSVIQDYMSRQSEETTGSPKVTPLSLTLDFTDDNTAIIHSNVALEGFGYSGEFKGKFASGLRYQRPRLYLDEVKLIDGGFTADDDVRSELTDIKNVAIDVLKRQREGRVDEATGKSVDNSQEKNTDIVENFTLSAVKVFTESVPIYNLTNAGEKGVIASLALKEVQFTDDEAIVTLSPKTALLRILGMLFTVLMVLLLVLPSALWSLSLEYFVRKIRSKD